MRATSQNGDRCSAVRVGGLPVIVRHRPDWGAAGPIIDVEKEGDRRIAVGVGSLQGAWVGRSWRSAGDVLAFDLELSGWFEPIRPGGIAPEGLGDWQRKGAEVVAEMSASLRWVHRARSRRRLRKMSCSSELYPSARRDRCAGAFIASPTTSCRR